LPHTLTDLVDFSDEEGYGKYLDLHHCYDCFINLKQMEVWCGVFLYDYCIYRGIKPYIRYFGAEDWRRNAFTNPGTCMCWALVQCVCVVP